MHTYFKSLYLDWCSTATTAERFFRIDRSQESLHYITDISSEDLYILDPELSPRARLSPGLAGAGAPNGHGETTPSAISNRSYISASSSAISFAFPVTPPKSPAFLQWVIWLARVVGWSFTFVHVVHTLGLWGWVQRGWYVRVTNDEVMLLKSMVSVSLLNNLKHLHFSF